MTYSGVYSRGEKDTQDVSYIDIPQSYIPESSKSIDPQEMNILFHLGFETASPKGVWLKEPDVFKSLYA